VPNAPSSAQPPPADESVQARPARTTRDMAISLIVLLIPVLFIVALFRLRGGEDTVIVDPAPAISAAAGVFSVSAPTDLGADWQPVIARFDREANGGVLRVGYVTPSGGGLQLIESNEPIDGLLIRELGDQTRPVGPVAVAGVQWRSYEVRNGERALVRAEPGRTLIVIGRAERAELEVLAAAVS
jgi:hypothetical protein